MKYPKIKILLPLLVFVLLISACTPQPVAGPTATVDVNPIYTAAAQTISAESTMLAALIPSSTPTVEVTATPGAPTETQSAVLTPVTLATSLPTMTPYVASGDYAYPIIHSTMNTNCRSGPGIQYPVVGALMPDQKVEVHGIYQAGGYWYIQNPTDTSKYCWVWSDTTVVDGNTNYLPVIQPPATPIAVMPHVSVSVAVSPVTSAVCPETFTYTATFTTSEATTLTYQWVREDGTTSSPEKIVFTDDGTGSASTTYVFKSAATGSAYVKILSPVTMKSNKAPFTLTCP